MVSNGLTYLRVFLRAVLVLAGLGLGSGGRAAELTDVADVTGTMPEDVLPELKMILDSALRRSPQLVAADFDRTVQEARIYGADSARLPSLRGNSEYASNQTAVTGSNSSQSRASGFFYRFEAGQAVFHWGALRNQSLAARLNLLASRKSYAIAARELGVVIRKAYLALVVERARLQQGRQALAVLRADLAVLNEKKQSGAVSAAVFEGERLRAREVTAELERGEAEFAANRRRLARLAGLPGGDLPEEKVAAAIPRPDFSEYRVTAMAAAVLRDGAKSTLEYEVYDLKVREASLRYAIERTRQLPKLNLGAGYSLENSTDVVGSTVNQQAFRRQNINLNVQWNIFDGFATRGAVREALAAKRLHERNLTLKVEETIQDVQLLERSLKLDAETIELAEIRRGMAVQARDRIAEEVGLGKLRRSEVERARVGELQADAKSLEARAQYFGRWSEFVAVAGSDPLIRPLSVAHAREK
jgi:outer membrane protein TolC